MKKEIIDYSNQFIRNVKDDFDFDLPGEVSVLGQTYQVIYTNHELCGREIHKTENGTVAGLCDEFRKKIYIDAELYYHTHEYTPDGRALWDLMEVLRHEIIHAYFNESGLCDEFEPSDNEILVDWLALKMPAMIKTMGNILDDIQERSID